jgi:hypothetical protein
LPKPITPDGKHLTHVTIEPKWKHETLPIGDVRTNESLQMRVGGLDKRHVKVLEQAIRSREYFPPIKVAKIGKALYVIDGYHRLEASNDAGCSTITAEVATMSLSAAKDFALLANTRHGKNLKPRDKALIFDTYVEREKHLDARGNVKPSRVIEAEINHVYSHESIRRRLKALGVELDMSVEFPGGYKPYRSDEDDEEDEENMAAYRAAGAHGHLSGFASLFVTLEDPSQRELIGIARKLLDSLERGAWPQEPLEQLKGVLDI